YTHFIDGEVYQKNKFFKQNKHVIQLQLYFDEFEVCNPLGTKTGIHKIGAFYFTLLNLYSHLNSNLNHIHLLALCYNYDIKQFGISPVLDVIVKDIKILESKGIYVDSLNSIVKGTLVSLSCDNLGCATLLGMNESFSSNYYCRICTISKTDAQKTETLNFFGIKKFTPLCELNHFKICENYSIDVMHDFLEGICQRDLKLFFTFLIETRLISLEELNERIQAFDYGLNNRPNIPSGIKISKTSNTPKITLEMLQDLETSTTMHHNILISNYAANLTLKDHIVTHYPMIIRKMGPPKNQWTMRYESKNGFLKSYAEKLKNFIDIGFTLAERNQKSMSCFWNNDIKSHLIETREISISKLEYKLIILDHFSLSEEIKITVGKRIKFMGSELLKNKFICTTFSNNLPIFSRSVLFFSIYDELFVICESWKTIDISTSCLGYLI
ncbi:GSCOCG00011750001-RA-CDS, partial [Cotesia congregata]